MIAGKMKQILVGLSEILGGKDRRIFSRHSPLTRIQAIIRKESKLNSIQILNLSAGGASIMGQNLELLIGDQVEIEFVQLDGQIIVCRAEVLNQEVYYRHGIQTLENAIYRFSLRFEACLDSVHLENLLSEQVIETRMEV